MRSMGIINKSNRFPPCRLSHLWHNLVFYRPFKRVFIAKPKGFAARKIIKTASKNFQLYPPYNGSDRHDIAKSPQHRHIGPY